MPRVNQIQTPTVSKQGKGCVFLVAGATLLATCLAALCVIAASIGILQYTRTQASAQPTVIVAVVDDATPVADDGPGATPEPASETDSQEIEGLKRPSTPTPAASISDAVAEQDREPVTADEGPPGDAETQTRVLNEVFDYVNDEYVYADFDRAGFEKRRAALQERIDSGLSENAFFEAMYELIESLGDSHSNFEDRLAVRERLSTSSTGIGVTVDVTKRSKQAVVEWVQPGSPADRAGVKVHDTILAIDGTPILDAEGQPRFDLLHGEDGSSVTLQLRAPGEEPRDVIVTRGEVRYSASVQARLLPGKRKIGYILVPGFSDNNIEDRTREALARLMDDAGGELDALVLDMRVNSGGFTNALYFHLSFFTTGEMGAFVNRAGRKEPLEAFDKGIGNSQQLPIAVLIGPSTASFGEVFAGALRASAPDRVALIGSPSAGNIEVLNAKELSDGSLAWIATQTFRLPDGSGWEGSGLKPDVSVEAEWDAVTPEKDAVIDAAVAYLESKP